MPPQFVGILCFCSIFADRVVFNFYKSYKTFPALSRGLTFSHEAADQFGGFFCPQLAAIKGNIWRANVEYAGTLVVERWHMRHVRTPIGHCG